ncbi:unnamed protein product, partial [Urochloa humidicola]
PDLSTRLQPARLPSPNPRHRRPPGTPGSRRDAGRPPARPAPPCQPSGRLPLCGSPSFDAQHPRTVVMEGQANTVKASLDPRVKANLVLGAESFAISSESGILSEQLATMKEKSMVILKEYITKHNAPNDVPDESLEGESDDEAEAIVKNPPKKSKKQK